MAQYQQYNQYNQYNYNVPNMNQYCQSPSYSQQSSHSYGGQQALAQHGKAWPNHPQPQQPYQPQSNYEQYNPYSMSYKSSDSQSVYSQSNDTFPQYSGPAAPHDQPPQCNGSNLSLYDSGKANMYQQPVVAEEQKYDHYNSAPAKQSAYPYIDAYPEPQPLADDVPLPQQTQQRYNKYMPKKREQIEETRKSHMYRIQAHFENGILSVEVYDAVQRNTFRNEFCQNDFPQFQIFSVAKLLVEAVNTMGFGSNKNKIVVNGFEPISILEYGQWAYLTVNGAQINGKQIPTFALRPMM